LAAEDYAKAARLLDLAERHSVRNAAIAPNWIGDTDQFWYRRDTAAGTDFQRVDARNGARSPAFDHHRVADRLARASGQDVAAENLPFSEFEYGPGEETIRFRAFGSAWVCSLAQADCAAAADPFPPASAVAPDGDKAVLRRDRNLWLRTAAGDERALTRDGVQFNEYGYVSGDLQIYLALEAAGGMAPVARWSPDATKFLTHRIDEREVGEMTIWQGAPPDGSRRPKVTVFRQSHTGDAHAPVTTYLIFDVERGEHIAVTNIPDGMEFDPIGGFGALMAEWAPDSQSVYVLARDRHYRRIGLYRIDAGNGEARLVIEETSSTSVNLNGRTDGVGHGVTCRFFDEGRQLLWFSERDGWGHLYRYDLTTGALLNQVTSGPWVVTEILDIDEGNGVVFFLATGREEGRSPYLSSVYRVNLDGTHLRLLTPEHADHAVLSAPRPGAAPGRRLPASKQYFVDTYSRVDTVPVSVLRATDSGQVLMTVEEADCSVLGEDGWPRPVPFVVKARDGATDIFGTMYLPSNFDEARKYPVIDHVYPGAHAIIPDVRGLSSFYFYRQALANLGFIVVNLDGLGTTGRGKAFHDLSYGNLQDGPGLPDHVAGIRELALHYPQIDLDRVGVFGHSSGGYGTVLAMLKFPDFFKVGVASAAAVDMCGAIPLMMDRWQGPPQPGVDYSAPVFLANMAAKLKGKLLIAYGEMDEHMPAATSIRLIDALTSADRDYDLVVMPNRAHGFHFDRYFVRRQFDYFVRHLLGSEPPPNASLTTG
jgi:dipeptidyl-peptidase-4